MGYFRDRDTVVSSHDNLAEPVLFTPASSKPSSPVGLGDPAISPHLQRGGCSCWNQGGLSGQGLDLLGQACYHDDLQFNKCLLSTYYMRGTTLEAGNND